MAERFPLQIGTLVAASILFAAACTPSQPHTENAPAATAATIASQKSTSTPAPTQTLLATSTSVPTHTPAPTLTETALAGLETALVVQVLDGVTIEVLLEGVAQRLRYIGIDSPEDGQPFSSEAETLNRSLVEGKQVALEKDVSETDRYDRLLRYVYLLDGTFVNAELVRTGMARAAA